MKTFKDILAEKTLKITDDLKQQTNFIIDDIDQYVNEGEDILKKIPKAKAAHKKLVADFAKFQKTMTEFLGTVAKHDKG